MTIESAKNYENRVERQAEHRESKEGEKDPELQAAAAMERAELLAKEVKNSKKQMQNIAINVANVKNTIAQLRAQLQLAASDDDPQSVQQDKQALEALKKKIALHQDELMKMRGDLIKQQMEVLSEGGTDMTPSQLQELAQRQVDALIGSAHDDE
ncbi:hypothetical protein H6758_02850 [Candidatus Nomurabacteria bacterium]|nr:hypothetical protein [Candidatus Nomurabacteria bacterium]